VVVASRMWLRYARRAVAILSELVVSRPEKVALRSFRRSHPAVQDSWSSVASIEPDRVVVCIFFGECRPAQYKFFSVSRDYRYVFELHDDRAYRPKGWI
jgi:hypothetical protein